MKRFNLRIIDLNLLPVLDILLEEKSVTLASRRVHLSQSATSSALRRLRETFNDPILVRRGQQMVPSPKALLIQKELNEALTSLGAVVSTMRSGEEPEENLNFAITAPEYVMMALSDTVRQLLAPGDRQINVNLEPFVRRLVFDQLEKGQIDIGIGAFGRLKPNFHRKKLYHEALVVVMRKGHPAIERHEDGIMDLDDFTNFQHLQVTAGEVLEDAWISKMLSARAVKRQVSAVLPNISLVPDVLRNTDLICVGTQRSLESIPRNDKLLDYLKMPKSLDIYDYDIEMIWHERNHEDPDIVGLRERVYEGSADLR